MYKLYINTNIATKEEIFMIMNLFEISMLEERNFEIRY